MLNAPEGAVLANASTDNYAAGAVFTENLYVEVKDLILAADGAVQIGERLIDLLLAAAMGEPVADTDTGCAFYTTENIDSDAIAPNLYD